MFRRVIRPGDRVIFQMHKYGFRPGPRAEDVQPAQHGESYSYRVNKFWLVTGRSENGTLELKTRRGKTRVVAENDPNLRRANFLELFWFAARFPR